MSKFRRRAWLCVSAAAAVLVSPATAGAFELKQTSGGLPVRWTSPGVEFVIDASVLAAAAGGDQAVAAAAQAWSGASGTPSLSTSPGKGATKPAIDGKNTIMFAPDGYPEAGGALAITLLSFDDRTGDIVDADIVINGVHAFAVLAPGQRAPTGSIAVSTEGGGGDDDSEVHASNVPKFDLQHVITHELGHALGLGDVQDHDSAIMYAYSMPDDASSRALTADDLAGVGELYAASSASPAAQASGCGGASIAATHVTPEDQWAAAGLVVGVGAWLASRRRARALVPVGAALVGLLGSLPRTHESVQAAIVADATAHVVSARTTNVGGVFETTLELVPRSCRPGLVCPARLEAHVLGGTLGGITQQVGDRRAPRADDEVRIAFSAGAADSLEGAVVVLSGVPRQSP